MPVTKTEIIAALASIEHESKRLATPGIDPESARMMLDTRRDLLLENAGDHRAWVREQLADVERVRSVRARRSPQSERRSKQ